MRLVALLPLEACLCLDSVVLAGQGVVVLCATYGSRLQWYKSEIAAIIGKIPTFHGKNTVLR